jgi:uncharacterized protein (TIGR02302 family)
VTAFPPGSAEAMSRQSERGQRLIAASRAAIWWERAWAASWRGLTVLGAGAVIALFDIWSIFPPGPRILLASALVTLAATFFWLDWRFVFFPGREAGIRRLEDENDLSHRPLSTAEDQLATGTGDPLTETLWRTHLARQLAAFGALEPVWPRPNVAARDPYALRGLVFVGLIAGLLAAGADAPRRLLSAFAVDGERAGITTSIAFDAWITPPGYTGGAPIIMAQARGTIPLDPTRVISVPAGSKLTLRVDGAHSPRVERQKLDGGDVAELAPDPKAPSETFSGEFELTTSERVRIFADGRKIGDWEITALPDAAPSVAFDGEIETTPRLSMRIPFTAGDDYGIAAAEAWIRLAPESREGDDPTAEEGDEEIVINLPLTGKDTKSFKSAAFEDLTAHPWAGLDVTVQLNAVDAAGQTASSEERKFKLPERVFANPLARAIIEQRRDLSRGPGAIPRVATALEAFTLAPERFSMKGSVFLGLRSAYWRLMQSRVRADVTGVQALLWDIALSLEDGGVTMAAEEVRRLQKELQKALAEGAPDEEIALLTEQLRQAMREMMQAMAEQAPGEMIPLVDGELVNSEDLEAMLDRIEELSKLGANEAAQELLSQLQDMMEGMSGPMAEPSEQERQLAQQLAELNEIVKEQEKLRDQTFREDQKTEQERADSRAAGEDEQAAGEQDKLGDRLDGVGEKIEEQGGEGPKELGEAGEAMDKAAKARREGDTGEALAQQEEALAKLKSAQDQARQALAAEQKKNGGMRVGRATGRRNPGMDPAGRPEANGPIDNGTVKVPTERETQRAREILNELRKRSGETDRPQPELDYLERLLRRF